MKRFIYWFSFLCLFQWCFLAPLELFADPDEAISGEVAETEVASEDVDDKPHSVEANRPLWVQETYRSLLPDPYARMMDFSVGPFTLGELVLSFSILLLTLLLRGFLTRIIFFNLEKLASKTRMVYDDRVLAALKQPVSYFLLIFGFYLALMALPMDPEWVGIFALLFRGVTMFLVFWGILRMIDIVSDLVQEQSQKRGSALGGFVPLIRKTVRVFVIMIGAVMVLDNLGYSVSGVLAGLGIGGAALAFASKDTIANLYGSVALALDRPFKVGDWIQVGDVVDGDVESIGLRSTKVRTWPKTQLSIPNAVLANEMINNWSRMPKRRVKQIVGVTYETTADQMEELVEAIKEILRKDPDVNQEFILVHFTDFGSSSLDILVYYFTNSIKWLEHLAVRQRVNCAIMRAIADRGLSIAFPTRTVYFEGDVAQQMAGVGKGKLPGDFGPDHPA